MAEATIMVIEVDLNCSKCYKKVKKILCKIPQIQDQVYDEKKNTVTIKVACSCNPEKIMQKIRCKGGSAPRGGKGEHVNTFLVGDLHVMVVIVESQFVIVGVVVVIVVARGVIIAGIVVVITIIVKKTLPLARLCNQIMLHRCIWSSIDLLV
ncbi:hypothetical protein Pint_09444 [Pistacia integerrima]|uniref:Uncharacterized protein n=1 Tax=Pistacia integerrima TaxID=434235 RepID=A0ACC0XPC3_9ROSI|nr:hypothetical protein Pint_09444 [Pistacia integerrima]